MRCSPTTQSVGCSHHLITHESRASSGLSHEVLEQEEQVDQPTTMAAAPELELLTGQRSCGQRLTRLVEALLPSIEPNEDAYRALVWLLQPIAGHPELPNALRQLLDRSPSPEGTERDAAPSSPAKGAKSLLVWGNSELHSLIEMLLEYPANTTCWGASGMEPWDAPIDGNPSRPAWEMVFNKLESVWLESDEDAQIAWELASWVIAKHPQPSPAWVLRLAIGYLQLSSFIPAKPPIWPTSSPLLQELTPLLLKVAHTSASPLEGFSLVLAREAPDLLPWWHYALRESTRHCESCAAALENLTQALSEGLSPQGMADPQSLTGSLMAISNINHPCHLEAATAELIELLTSLSMHAQFGDLCRPVWEELSTREFSKEEALQLFSLLHTLPDVSIDSCALKRLAELLSKAFGGLTDPMQIWVVLRQLHMALHPTRSDRGPRSLEHVLDGLWILWTAKPGSLAKASWQLAANLTRARSIPASSPWMTRLDVGAVLLGTQAEWLAVCTSRQQNLSEQPIIPGGSQLDTLVAWGCDMVRQQSEHLPAWCQALSDHAEGYPICRDVLLQVARAFRLTMERAAIGWSAKVLATLPWHGTDAPTLLDMLDLMAARHIPQRFAGSTRLLWEALADQDISYEQLQQALTHLHVMPPLGATASQRLSQSWIRACSANKAKEFAQRLREVMIQCIDQAPHMMKAWIAAIQSQTTNPAQSLQDGSKRCLIDLFGILSSVKKPSQALFEAGRELQHVTQLYGLMSHDLLRWRAFLFCEGSGPDPLEWAIFETWLKTPGLFGQFSDENKASLIHRATLYIDSDQRGQQLLALKALLPMLDPARVKLLPARQLQRVEALCSGLLLLIQPPSDALVASAEGGRLTSAEAQRLAAEWFILTVDVVPRSAARSISLLERAHAAIQLPPDRLLSLCQTCLQSAEPSKDLQDALRLFMPQLDQALATRSFSEHLSWVDIGLRVDPPSGWHWLADLAVSLTTLWTLEGKPMNLASSPKARGGSRPQQTPQSMWREYETVLRRACDLASTQNVKVRTDLYVSVLQNLIFVPVPTLWHWLTVFRTVLVFREYSGESPLILQCASELASHLFTPVSGLDQLQDLFETLHKPDVRKFLEHQHPATSRLSGALLCGISRAYFTPIPRGSRAMASPEMARNHQLMAPIWEVLFELYDNCRRGRSPENAADLDGFRCITSCHALKAREIPFGEELRTLFVERSFQMMQDVFDSWEEENLLPDLDRAMLVRSVLGQFQLGSIQLPHSSGNTEVTDTSDLPQDRPLDDHREDFIGIILASGLLQSTLTERKERSLHGASEPSSSSSQSTGERDTPERGSSTEFSLGWLKPWMLYLADRPFTNALEFRAAVVSLGREISATEDLDALLLMIYLLNRVIRIPEDFDTLPAEEHPLYVSLAQAMLRLQVLDNTVLNLATPTELCELVFDPLLMFSNDQQLWVPNLLTLYRSKFESEGKLTASEAASFGAALILQSPSITNAPQLPRVIWDCIAEVLQLQPKPPDQRVLDTSVNRATVQVYADRDSLPKVEPQTEVCLDVLSAIFESVLIYGQNQCRFGTQVSRILATTRLYFDVCEAFRVSHYLRRTPSGATSTVEFAHEIAEDLQLILDHTYSYKSNRRRIELLLSQTGLTNKQFLPKWKITRPDTSDSR
ncbi:MAG: hypothetical protein ACOYKZ_00040 [Chlamydiia bacterium]